MSTCTQQSGTCLDCRSACERKPGWFMPGEAEQAAAHLGLTLQEFFDEHLAVDWWEADDDLPLTFVLSPAIIGGVPGEEFPGNPRGTCVFYQAGRCSIHEVKPYECRVYWCGHSGPARYHRDVAAAWNTPDNQQQIRDLLGREPEEAAYLGGLFGGLLGSGW